MKVDYPYITQHFNHSTEYEMSYTYDTELEEITNKLSNDPRLPEYIRVQIPKYKYFHRDLMRRAIRSYAYSIRYPQHIPEPIAVMKSALYYSIKHLLGNQRYTVAKQTAKWRRVYAEILLDELYDEAVYMEKFTKSDSRIKILNYWGNGLSKNQVRQG